MCVLTQLFSPDLHAGVQIREHHNDPHRRQKYDRHDPGIEEQVAQHRNHQKQGDRLIRCHVRLIGALIDHRPLRLIAAFQPFFLKFS